jgi:hypothetical protein
VGHAAVRPADPKEFAELFSVFIILHEGRPRKVGTLRSTAGVRSVAEAAFRGEQLLSALDRGRIEPRSSRRLLRRGDRGDKPQGHPPTRVLESHHILNALED